MDASGFKFAKLLHVPRQKEAVQTEQTKNLNCLQLCNHLVSFSNAAKSFVLVWVELLFKLLHKHLVDICIACIEIHSADNWKVE